MADPATATAALDLGPLYALVGTAVVGQVAGAIVGIVKWLGSRTVQREDKDKEDFKADLKAHDERFTEIEQSLREMDRTVLTVQTDVKAVSGAVETIRSTVVELRAALENRFDKQSEFYRAQMKELMAQVTEQLEKVEFDLRQDTTRAITDAKMQLAAEKRGRK